MNVNVNYQKELDKIIESLAGQELPRLLLHSCCAPCSSYVLEYLRPFFEITVFYYNPNISMETEYLKRAAEQKRLIAAYNETLRGKNGTKPREETQNGDNLRRNSDGFASIRKPISIIEGDYEPGLFFEMAKGYEDCPEGGERCFMCYELRLRKTSQIAKEGGFDYFCTTLSISPHKNAPKINEIGERLAGECGVKWLPSDFKKKGGYLRSIKLSEEYGLYRQDYCGCAYSKRE